MKKFRSPLLEISIVILAGALIWVLGYPQYEEREKISKRYQVMVNMYALRVAIENYAAYNGGKFPKSTEDFKPFFIPPLNPYRNKPINADDIIVFQYTSKDEPKEISTDSKNGRMYGEPGGLGYGYFICPEDTITKVSKPTYRGSCAYGIIGFDNKGAPLAEKLPSGKTEVFVIFE